MNVVSEQLVSLVSAIIVTMVAATSITESLSPGSRRAANRSNINNAEGMTANNITVTALSHLEKRSKIDSDWTTVMTSSTWPKSRSEIYSTIINLSQPSNNNSPYSSVDIVTRASPRPGGESVDSTSRWQSHKATTAVNSTMTSSRHDSVTPHAVASVMRGPLVRMDALAMPVYAWILALLFGICCGLALLAAGVGMFRCARRQGYVHLGSERLPGVLAYMQHVYGSALLGLRSRSESGSERLESSLPAGDVIGGDYTFVGVSIPLLQDVTRI